MGKPEVVVEPYRHHILKFYLTAEGPFSEPDPTLTIATRISEIKDPPLSPTANPGPSLPGTPLN